MSSEEWLERRKHHRDGYVLLTMDEEWRCVEVCAARGWRERPLIARCDPMGYPIEHSVGPVAPGQVAVVMSSVARPLTALGGEYWQLEEERTAPPDWDWCHLTEVAGGYLLDMRMERREPAA